MPTRRLVQALAACVAALSLAACGGGGGGDASPADPGSRATALAVSQPGELGAYVQARLRQRAAAPTVTTDVLLAPAAGA